MKLNVTDEGFALGLMGAFILGTATVVGVGISRDYSKMWPEKQVCSPEIQQDLENARKWVASNLDRVLLSARESAEYNAEFFPELGVDLKERYLASLSTVQVFCGDLERGVEGQTVDHAVFVGDSSQVKEAGAFILDLPRLIEIREDTPVYECDLVGSIAHETWHTLGFLHEKKPDWIYSVDVRSTLRCREDRD